MEKEQIIIDCDPGSDDALAIILALHSEKIDLKAVCSVTGNGALDTTTRNGCNILSLCGRKDIPLYRGSGAALDEKIPHTVSAFGDDGLGGYADTILSDKIEERMHAVDFLVEYVNDHPGRLHFCNWTMYECSKSDSKIQGICRELETFDYYGRFQIHR